MAEDIETQRDIGKLWGELREFRAETNGRFERIMTILTGVSGTNGLSGRIGAVEGEAKRIEAKVDDAVEWGRKVVDVDRHTPGWCIGKRAVDELEARMDSDTRLRTMEMVEMKKARYAMLTGMGVAALTGVGAIILEMVK